MLAIKPSSPQKTTPNLLPARISHNGPINSVSRYWTPSTDDKGAQHVHFRGRHLHGKSIPLPENYTGAVLQVTDEQLPASQMKPTSRQTPGHDEEDDGEDEMEEELEVEIAIAKQIGEFDEIVIWEHGGVVDAERDGFVRGLGEWVGFAEKIHCDEGDEEAEAGKKDA